MLDGLDNVIVSLYAKGMSNSDIEEQIRKYNFDVSTSTISRITDSVSTIFCMAEQTINPVYLIVWMDGF
jgi:transposase-like protein